MQIQENGQGHLRTNLSGRLAYQSFVPASLQQMVPQQLQPLTVKRLTACAATLGNLQGMLRVVPNQQLYLAMYVRKEALLSSQIEGTQCTFEDIFDPSNPATTRREVADVVAYVRATEFALQKMEELPLCTRLLREVHVQLMEGTRGANKGPGQLRKSQNWIGPGGCTLATAQFVPPCVEDMHEALADLDQFINVSPAADPIVRAALVHYQFETIHPFLDGNGRLGRLLITLMLVNDGLLSGLLFYPSYQFKLRRDEYYGQLMAVRERGCVEEWVAFFAECLQQAAEDAVRGLERLLTLHRRSEEKIGGLGRVRLRGLQLLNLLEEQPILDVACVMERLEISRPTAMGLLNAFLELGILQEPAGKQRYRMFVYGEYLEILREGDAPLGDAS